MNHQRMQARTEKHLFESDVAAGLLYAAYERMPISLLLSALVALGFGSLLIAYFPPVLMTVWIAAVVLCSALRFGLWAAFRRASPAANDLKVWRRLYFVGALVAGIAWSLGPTFTIERASSAQITLIVGTLLSVCAVATSSLASQRAAMHAFLAASLLPPAIAVMRNGQDDLNPLIASMVIAGMFCSMISGHRSSVAIRDALQAQYKLRSVIAELTESRAALQESEQRYRGLAEWSPDAITVLRDDIVIYVNPAAITLIGALSSQQLLGRSVADFVHSDSMPLLAERLRLLKEGGINPPKAELRFRKLDGVTIDVETQSTPIVYDGAPAIFVAIRDVTERKRTDAARESLEMQLRESQKMQAIGTLAGGIAHDFNNIIAIILGNAELARQDRGTQREAADSLDEIRKAGMRARGLVQQILSFSRRQPTEHRSISLPTVVDEAVRLLRSTLPARVVISVDADTKLPNVLADATQMQQVVINLCTNASQAMQGVSGKIQVRIDSVVPNVAAQNNHPALHKFCERHPGRVVRLSVSDNGYGMDAATVGRIFEPFFTTKAVDEGTGLGLSVVHGIVQTHQGIITVDSQVGTGSCFTLYLPATETTVEPIGKDGTSVAADAPQPQATRSRHILYLDDDEALVFLVERLMQRRGYRVSGFSDQQAALTALREAPGSFDVVITDYNMPGMSGLDIAREVRAVRSDLQVAVVSGFIDETLHAEANQAGVTELIFKANAVNELCEAFGRLAQTTRIKA